MKVCKDNRIWGQINTDYHDSEYIKKQREAKLGDKNPSWKGGISSQYCNNYVKKGHNPNSIGKPYKKGDCVGSKNPNYKGGITPLQSLIRNLSEYKGWQHSVFVRDGYSCVECHKIGGNLNAHHIKSFSKIMEENQITNIWEAQLCKELWDVNNGVTLCVECHKLTFSKLKKKARWTKWQH